MVTTAHIISRKLQKNGNAYFHNINFSWFEINKKKKNHEFYICAIKDENSAFDSVKARSVPTNSNQTKYVFYRHNNMKSGTSYPREKKGWKLEDSNY